MADQLMEKGGKTQRMHSNDATAVNLWILTQENKKKANIINDLSAKTSLSCSVCLCFAPPFSEVASQRHVVNWMKVNGTLVHSLSYCCLPV